jgi:hypothetical protein
MGQATNTTATTIDIAKPHWSTKIALSATLTRVEDPAGYSVLLVQLDEETARFFGARDVDGSLLADRTIGGLFRTRSGKWAVVAYFDRDEFKSDPYAFSEYLPVDATSRAHAVRMLARLYFVRFRNAKTEEREPLALTTRDYRNA